MIDTATGVLRPAVPVGADSAHQLYPVYSPDGAWLYYTSAHFSQGTVAGTVWRFDAASGAAERVGPPPSGCLYVLPAVSPDGGRMMTTCAGQLASVDLRTGARADLSEYEAGYVLAITNTRWSPDGRWLLARTEDGLAVVDPLDGRVLPLPFHREHGSALWRP